MAPGQGIEPRFAVLETDVMPLYQPGIGAGSRIRTGSDSLEGCVLSQENTRIQHNKLLKNIYYYM